MIFKHCVPFVLFSDSLSLSSEWKALRQKKQRCARPPDSLLIFSYKTHGGGQISKKKYCCCILKCLFEQKRNKVIQDKWASKHIKGCVILNTIIPLNKTFFEFQEFLQNKSCEIERSSAMCNLKVNKDSRIFQDLFVKNIVIVIKLLIIIQMQIS